MGQWGPDAKRAYGYSKQDVGILQNPTSVSKIYKKWSNTHNEFDFYFLRSNEARKQIEVGEVSQEWVKQNLKVDIQPRKDAITVIFTQNTGAEKIPMTAWTIAHRLGHAIRRTDNFERYLSGEIAKDFRELLKKIYGIDKTQTNKYSYGYGYGYNPNTDDEKELRALAQAVGTMRSARQGNLRNFFEFTYELIAQWIITGKIKFNPLPRSLTLRKRMAWGRPADDVRNSRISSEEHAEWNEVLQNHADKYEHHIDSIFEGLVGKMYVM
jgi:hypothetical protein